MLHTASGAKALENKKGPNENVGESEGKEAIDEKKKSFDLFTASEINSKLTIIIVIRTSHDFIWSTNKFALHAH